MTDRQTTTSLKRRIRRYLKVDRRSPLLTAWEYGYATAVQARTLDAGATREARQGYADGEADLIEVAP